MEIVMAEGEESEENNHRITLHTQNTTLSHSYNMISCHSSYIVTSALGERLLLYTSPYSAARYVACSVPLRPSCACLFPSRKWSRPLRHAEVSPGE